MKLRDREFEEYYRIYMATTKLDDPNNKAPENKRMRIAIIHVGAPAGGINAATRAATTYCLSRGHRPFAIDNGFPGLVRHNSVKELDWLTVDNWAIQTRRSGIQRHSYLQSQFSRARGSLIRYTSYDREPITIKEVLHMEATDMLANRPKFAVLRRDPSRNRAQSGWIRDQS
jgi:hypothetical protein